MSFQLVDGPSHTIIKETYNVEEDVVKNLYATTCSKYLDTPIKI